MTTVRLPVRVRLDLAEDRAGDPRLPELVGEAVGAAARRAIDRARGMAGLPAGDDTPSRFSIGFTGDPLAQPVAAGLEAAIRAALCEAAAGLRAQAEVAAGPARAASRSGAGWYQAQAVPGPGRPGDEAYPVPGRDDKGAPPVVRREGTPASVAGDLASGIEGDYAAAELRDAIRAAFPATGGAPRPGIYYGIYGRLRGASGPRLYYVRLREGGEVIDSIFLYFEPPRRGEQRVQLRSEERRVPMALKPGIYTVVFDPGGGGMLFRNHELVDSGLENPSHLGLTVAFVVDPEHAVYAGTPAWKYVPVTRIAATNFESQLATGAQSTYGAYTDIWRVDEYGVPMTINEFAIFGVDIHYRWQIVRLPAADSPHAAPEVVYEIQGYAQRAIHYTWQKPGQYEVTCTVTVHGQDVSPGSVTDSRKERVIERALKMAIELGLLERHEKKKHQQIWAHSAAELLAKAEADLRDEEQKPDRNEARVDHLKDVVSKLRDQLFPAGRAATGPFPIHAVFMDKKTSQTRPVSLFLAFEHNDASALEEEISGGVAAYHWYLIDVTYPAFYRTYEGNGTTAREALLSAFHDSETSFRRTYPPGQILVKVTVADMKRYGIEALTGSTGTDFTHTFDTDSWHKDAYEWLTLGLQVVGVAALAASFFFPPSAGLTYFLVITGLAGAALSVASIADRVAHGNFYWDIETFGDIANIVASIAQLGALTTGARVSALARVVSTAEELSPELIASLKLAEKVQRALLLTQLGTDVANGVILGYGTYEQLHMVDAEFDDQSLGDYIRTYGSEDGRQRWLQDRQNRITEIFAHAILNGTMIVVSGAGGAEAYAQARSRATALQELAPGPRPRPGGGPGEPPGPGPGGGQAGERSGTEPSGTEPSGTEPPGPEPPPEQAAAAGAGSPAAGTTPPPPATKPEKFFTALARLAGLDQAAAGGTLRLLPEQQVAEMVRLANLLDVPENATASMFRAEAAAKGVSREVQQLADTLSLARRIELKAETPGGATQSVLSTLTGTGWSQSSLEALIGAVPRQRFADWSEVATRLRPEQIQRLGPRGLRDLATSPRLLSFAAESGGDAYLAVLGRAHGDTRAMEELLHGLALRRAEIADPAEYYQLRDRMVAGDASAYAELRGARAETIRRAADAAAESAQTAPRNADGLPPSWDYATYPYGPRRRWRPGMPVDMPDGAGNYPAWDTIRKRVWRTKASDALAKRRAGAPAGTDRLIALDPTGVLSDHELEVVARTGQMPERVAAEIEHKRIPQRMGRLLEEAGLSATDARELTKLGDASNLDPTVKEWHAAVDQRAREINPGRNPQLTISLDDRAEFPLGSATNDEIAAIVDRFRQREIDLGGTDAGDKLRKILQVEKARRGASAKWTVP